MYNLKNKNVVITGASKGIGESLVRKFAKYKANIYLISRDVTRMEKIVSNITKKNNQKISYISLDISKEDDVNLTFKKITKNVSVDILINNAGITADNLLLTMKSNQWHDVINTNLNGCYYCSKAVIKGMIKQKSGKIINISSIIGITGNKGQANYAASKSGILGLTKSLAKEVASRNITVNAINPGYIKTEMTKDLNNKDKFLDNIPLQRFGLPDDIANLACFLASDEASYITGQAINIDGGMVM